MLYSFLDVIPIVIVIYCLLNIKKKDYFWNLLISVGILPFVTLIFTFVYSTFSGSGLVGDTGGIDSGIFAIIVSLFYFWYIYIGAIILLIFSIKKKKKINEKKELSIIEKALMVALIVTNSIFILNWFSVGIINRPLLLYKLFDISNNVYYGIGVTVNKTNETGISYYIDFFSLITFLCIIFAISLIFLKLKKARQNKYKKD